MNDNKIENNNLLIVENIHKHFDGIVALDGASVEVKGGKIISLIGPNGSGKTTLFNVITGWTTKSNLKEKIPLTEEKFDKELAKTSSKNVNILWKFLKRNKEVDNYIVHDTGKVEFSEERIDNLTAHEIALEGLLRTFQTTRNWLNLTVLENLLVAPYNQTGENIFNVFFKRKQIKEEERINTLKALEILDFLEISHIRDQLSSELSGGQLKLLAIGRLLMSAPQLILLDEPLAGVNPTLGNKIMDKIVELKGQNTIFLIEHDMDLVFNYSDEIFVMARGKVIANGKPEEIQNNKEVIEAYLGVDY